MELHAASPEFVSGKEYPPPPRVHWFALLAAWGALASLIQWLAPKPYQNLLNSIVINSWPFYLTMWIRSLDQDARSPFWCDVYVIVELACALMTIQQNPSPLHQDITVILEWASGILGIATIYLIRADLLKHYNQREPIGLSLSVGMTWFFSFLYFQSQLYAIAELKRRQSE